jgi:iron(III) transport system substrate-binding protein
MGRPISPVGAKVNAKEETMKRCTRTIFSVVVFSCFAGLLFPVPRALCQSEHTAKLIDGAKKEGKLVWYTNINVKDARLILDAFERRYPFINSEFFRAGGEQVVNRILTEARAGQWRFDVVTAGHPGLLVHHKLTAPYVSPEAKAYHQDFKGKDGLWTAFTLQYYVLGYNTKLVPLKEAPKSWEDLLDPRWKGKMAIDQEDYYWYATLLAAWGSERTERYLRALARQEIQWRNGHTLITQLMAAGEFAIGIVYARIIEAMKKNDAQLEWVKTTDPIVVYPNAISYSSKPNHPNAGKLFIDFVLSKEFQEFSSSAGRVSARSDVKPLAPDLDNKQLRLKTVPEDVAVRYNEYLQEFKNIFGL